MTSWLLLLIVGAQVGEMSLAMEIWECNELVL